MDYQQISIILIGISVIVLAVAVWLVDRKPSVTFKLSTDVQKEPKRSKKNKTKQTGRK